MSLLSQVTDGLFTEDEHMTLMFLLKKLFVGKKHLIYWLRRTDTTIRHFKLTMANLPQLHLSNTMKLEDEN